MKRGAPFFVAWSASVLAVIFGLAPAFSGPAEFDPIIALTVLTVLGLVWYTYFTRQTLEHSRQTAVDTVKVRKRALSTAVLAELWGVTARLRVLRERGPSNLTRELIGHPMTTMAASDPAVFEPSTVHALALTLRRINDVAVLLDGYPDLVRQSKDKSLSAQSRQIAEDKRVETMQGIRIRATWAFSRAADLVMRLKAEGGTPPTVVDEQETNMFDVPPLVDDPFDRSQ